MANELSYKGPKAGGIAFEFESTPADTVYSANDGTTLYKLDGNDPTIILDTFTPAVVDKIWSAVLAFDDSRLYISNGTSSSAPTRQYELDKDTGAILNDLGNIVSSETGTWVPGFVEFDGELWITLVNRVPDWREINPDTGATIQNVTSAQILYSGNGMDYESEYGEIVSVNGNLDRWQFIDKDTLTVLRTAPDQGLKTYNGVGYPSLTGNSFWIIDTRVTSQFYEYNTGTNALIRTIPKTTNSYRVLAMENDVNLTGAIRITDLIDGITEFAYIEYNSEQYTK